MKKAVLSLLFVFACLTSFPQSEKQVKWNYSVKKLNDKTFEVHMTATIGENFHMYAQNVGVDGPVGTAFTFTKNPLIVLDGNVKEVGKLVKKFESVWNGNVNYYEKTVDFVQVVKLKANVKTNLSGKVEFMVCDEKLCLPPSDVPIKINIGG
ncbi:MAG: protein-disulfide reductase DsbD domain-containing protein [Chitinophagaceae bacterium]